MKKTICTLFLLFMLLFSAKGWAAEGTVTQTLTTLSSNVSVLTFVCTANSSSAVFPTTRTDGTITAAIKGKYIQEVRTIPGATGPTNGVYDIAINEGTIDLMGGSMANLSSTLTQRWLPLIATSTYGKTPISDTLSLVITSNAVNSAVVTVKVFISTN